MPALQRFLPIRQASQARSAFTSANRSYTEHLQLKTSEIQHAHPRLKRKSGLKFAPTEVSDIWLNSDDYRSDRLHLYMWDETHCRKLDDLEAHALALAKLRIFFEPALWLATIANAKNSVGAAKLHIVGSAEIQDHPSHPMIPLLNGCIHLDDGNLLEHMKEDYLQHVVNCAYEPVETSPRFMEYLKAALPDPEARGRVQEFIGSTLLADDFGLHHQWLGRGAHALAKVLRELLGNAKVTTDTLD